MGKSPFVYHIYCCIQWQTTAITSVCLKKTKLSDPKLSGEYEMPEERAAIQRAPDEPEKLEIL